MVAPGASAPLIRRYGTDDSDLRLICFHHAGGSPAWYRGWPAHLPPSVGIDAVLLPGRDGLFREPAYDRMGPLVDAVVAALAPRLDQPYALFGYSMGAQVAYNVAHAIRAAGRPGPAYLFVAASPGPSLEREIPAWNESDEKLVDYLRDIGGTPAAMLNQRDLLELTLPTLRADLTVVATCSYQRRPPLDCAIHAFAGAADDRASPPAMAAWERETNGPFRQTTYPGGHFFIETALADVIAAIATDLDTRLPLVGAA